MFLISIGGWTSLHQCACHACTQLGVINRPFSIKCHSNSELVAARSNLCAAPVSSLPTVSHTVWLTHCYLTVTLYSSWLKCFSSLCSTKGTRHRDDEGNAHGCKGLQVARSALNDTWYVKGRRRIIVWVYSSQSSDNIEIDELQTQWEKHFSSNNIKILKISLVSTKCILLFFNVWDFVIISGVHELDF